MRLPWRRGRVERMRRNGDVEGPLRVLSTRDLVVDSEGRTIDLAAADRVAAARVLADYDAIRVVNALGGALTYRDVRVRGAALEAVA